MNKFSTNEKEASIDFAGIFCGLTIFQIAFFSNNESVNKIFGPIEQQAKYFLWPGIVLGLVLPWSPDLYATYPALLAFPIAANSFLYTGLFVVVFLLARKVRVQTGVYETSGRHSEKTRRRGTLAS